MNGASLGAAPSGGSSSWMLEINTIISEFLIGGGDDTNGCPSSPSAFCRIPSDPEVGKRMDALLQYPLREVEAVAGFAMCIRKYLDAACAELTSMLPQQDTSASPVVGPSPSTMTTTTATGENYLHLEHRIERLVFLGHRIAECWNALIPSRESLQEMKTSLVVAVESLNPWGFPDTVPGLPDIMTLSSDGGGASVQDWEACGNSPLYRLFHRFTVAGFDREIKCAMQNFESERLSGTESAALGLDGAQYHGQMPEVRQSWKRMCESVSLMCMLGMVLHSAIVTKRRDRALVMTLFENGCFDDAFLNDLGQAEDDEASSEVMSSPTSATSEQPFQGNGREGKGTGDGGKALLKTATTRLQMARLSRLIATCRVLDATGAESALKKIQFEHERRSSLHEIAVHAASAAGSLSQSQLGRRSTTVAVSFLQDATEEQSVNDGAASVNQTPLVHSVRSAGALRSRPSLTVTVSNSECETPSSHHGNAAVDSSLADIRKSIIPVTTLMDLEMIARTYSLDIPVCTLPMFPMGGARMTSATPGAAFSAMKAKLAKKTPTACGGSDEEYEHIRSHQRYAKNVSDVGMITEDCMVSARADGYSQTLLIGAVHEERAYMDVQNELLTTRRALSESLQSLMLERQRCTLLLSQLESLQRQRQEVARRSAAAGGNGDDFAAQGPLGNGESRSSSPLSASSRTSPTEAITRELIPESSVDAVLRTGSLMNMSMFTSKRKMKVASATSPQRQQQQHVTMTSPNNDDHDASHSLRHSHAHASSDLLVGDESLLLPPEENTVGPIAKRFTLLGRLDRPVSPGGGGRSPNRSPTPSEAASVPTAKQRGHAISPLKTPAPAARHMQTPPRQYTIERQFGKTFANKLKALGGHDFDMVDVHTTQDMWSGKTEIGSVICPVGIDPRHARMALQAGAGSLQARGEQQQQHHHHQISDPSLPHDKNSSIGSSSKVMLKPTHYGTVRTS